MKQLPSKPSDLIELALQDLESVEKSPKYEVYMSEWHAYTPGADICSVCLAGAVMAQTLKVRRKQFKSPDEIKDKATQNALYALNSFRLGSISHGLKTMEIPHDKVRNIHIPPYAEHPRKFKTAMSKMAVSLRKKGL